MSTLKVGFSRRDITPPLGTVLYGYPQPHTAERIHDRLQANVIALSQNDERALLFSFDVCSVPQEVRTPLCEALEKETGVPKKNILTAAIHTHSGPSLSTTAGWGEADTEYINEIFIPQTLEAAKEAVKTLTPAEMGIGETLSEAGINRREFNAEGIVILGQNPEAVYDPKMRVLAFRTPEGKPLVNLIHYGAHATATGNTADITRDWPGYMTDRLEQFTGAPSVFFNGAEGDVGPRVRNGKTIGDLEQAQEIGEIAGTDAVRAYRGITQYQNHALSVKTGTIRLPYLPLPSLEEAEEALHKLGDPKKLEDVKIKLYDALQFAVEFQKSGQKAPAEWQFDQTYVAIGPVVFVPYPFEMFCQISLNQQKKSPFPYTLCVALCNGSVSYLPTKEQIPYGGYEVDSFYASRFNFEDDAEAQIVEENKKLLEALFG